MAADTLTTTDHTSTQRTWTLAVDDWARAACDLAGRDLTDQERERFLSDLSGDTAICDS